MRLHIALLPAVLMLASCVSSEKTYKPPDDTKVKTATHDLNVKVNTARETARKTKQAAEEAKIIHEQMMKDAVTLKQLLDSFALTLPDEYKGPLREINNVVDDLLGQNAALDEKLKQLTAWNIQLEAQLADAEKARATLQSAQDEYAGGAAELAITASTERSQKIVVQKKLLWYRVRFWGAWVALGAAVLGWVIFGLLKVGVRWGTR